MSKELRTIALTTVDPWALAWRELNDIGNAERLVARAGGTLLHVKGWGWTAYDTRRWSTEDGERLASLKAQEVARGVRDEIGALTAIDDKALPDWCSPDMRTERVIALRKHAIQSGNAAKTKAMLEQAANLDALTRRIDDFDQDLLVVNAANRTLRFARTPGGSVMSDAPHDAADLLTRVLGCDWDPEAKSQRWDDHMAAVLPNPETRAYFQKLIGYSVTGLTIEQIFIMLQGKGGDGKSTTMNVIRIIMGGYAVVGNVKTFLDGADQSAGAATPELVRFVGDTRLISLQEPKRRSAIAEERVKQFTGGSPVTVRANYGDEFEFDPRGKVIMEVNSRPRISGDDDGIWRRIILILFPRQFKGGAIHKGMVHYLLEERSGILNWMLAGVHAYLREGLDNQPPDVAAAIEEYRRSANPFSEWMAARADLSDARAVTLSSTLFADYKEWCEAEQVGEREVMNSTAFGRALGDRQLMLGPRDRTGKKTRRGIQLRTGTALPEAPDDDDVP